MNGDKKPDPLVIPEIGTYYKGRLGKWPSKGEKGWRVMLMTHYRGIAVRCQASNVIDKKLCPNCASMLKSVVEQHLRPSVV